ncbi:Hsp20/alpha crystallin family protein [Saliphagus sp. LR7]|uniref:Hsp20/alpha crystallin family protein n=1 Tax=Saliphagus sp. LR7 TaxID=2282654 RepID=UPI000DF7FB65|nr:Hsp20/alpha crystallin family protein [Saliphagus sp. LR7]
MTDRPPNDGDRSDDRRESARGGSWISTLIDALERLENRSGRSGLDYDVSIRSGLEGLGGDTGLSERAGRPSGPPGSRGGDGGGRVRRRSDDHHVSTRTYDDEVIVTADISGADPDDVTVGFDDSTLVVGVAGRELERVHVPWPDSAADAVVRNGMLTVTVEPDDEDDEDGEGGETR